MTKSPARAARVAEDMSIDTSTPLNRRPERLDICTSLRRMFTGQRKIHPEVIYLLFEYNNFYLN